MAELADALDLGSSVNRCAGSSPVARTILSVHNQPESWEWALDFFISLIIKVCVTNRVHRNKNNKKKVEHI